LGQDMEVVFQKNKTAPPNRSCLFSLHFKDTGLYAPGSSNIGEQMLALGEYWGYIQKAGSWYVIEGEKAQGAKAAAELLLSNESLFEDIKRKVWAHEVDWLGGEHESD